MVDEGIEQVHTAFVLRKLVWMFVFLIMRIVFVLCEI